MLNILLLFHSHLVSSGRLNVILSNLFVPRVVHDRAIHNMVRRFIMVIELSGVQFALKSYA